MADRPPVGEPVLVASGIDVFYGKVQTLYGVDFEVREGEIVALLGVNGAGKSSLGIGPTGDASTEGGLEATEDVGPTAVGR